MSLQLLQYVIVRASGDFCLEEIYNYIILDKIWNKFQKNIKKKQEKMQKKKKKESRKMFIFSVFVFFVYYIYMALL